MIPLLRRFPGLGLVGLMAIGGLTAGAPARAGMVENMILSKCSETMLGEFKKAGQTPPAGMVDETCHCVLKGWLNKQGLDVPIKTCSAAATAKYGLNKTTPATTSKQAP
ncbi:MAG: hypothetical protein RLZZ624_286 [Cyanobacteriota bacterium]